MAKNRRATATVFGFDFQVNAAIVLMLENVKEFKNIRLEGNYEDIEIELEDGSYILAQAKSVEKSSTDFRHVRQNLKKSLISLSEGSHKVNAKQLILITNSPNPLNQEETKSIFYGTAHREFSTLPESSQKLILEYIKDIETPLNLDDFMIQILPFETDNESERYKAVKQYIDEFTADLYINFPGIGKTLHELWRNDIFTNGSKKDADIKLSKSDIIWPIIAYILDIKRLNDDFADEFDSCLYDEIIYRYSDIINSCCERFEFATKVLYDYKLYENAKKNRREKCKDFANDKWSDYLDELKVAAADDETQEGIVKIILYNIVRNRLAIDKIKSGVNL